MKIFTTIHKLKCIWSMFAVAVGFALLSGFAHAADTSPLGVVQITPLTGGSVKFSIRLPEEKDQVHLFARRNGLQDYDAIDVQSQTGGEVNNGDGTFTYQVTRTGVYTAGNLIEARFYSYKPSSGQIFYPGPNHLGWVGITYQPPSSSSSVASSLVSSSSSVPASSSSVSSSSSLSNPVGVVQITPLAGGSIKFSIKVSEKKDQVHLFARRNGLQDYDVIDLQTKAGGEVNNGDGTYTYQSTRSGVYVAGDLVEARFYTYKPSSGQTFHPGPAQNNWVSLTYNSVSSSSISSSSIPRSSSSVAISSSISSSRSSSSIISSSSISSSRSSSSTTVVSSSSGNTSSIAMNVVPLYNSSTVKEQDIQIRDGNKLITRIADRGRDRHAKEDQYQAYDHFLSHYWEHRTATIEIIDEDLGSDLHQITMNVKTQFPLNTGEAENRWFYQGIGTVAEFCGGHKMKVIDPYTYVKSSADPEMNNINCRTGKPIKKGDKLEFEMSQFLAHDVPHGRSAYYGTTFLYIVGKGLVPWTIIPGMSSETIAPVSSGREDSVAIDEKAWLGGNTTLQEMTSNEPDNHFIQMATNLASQNGQPFVEGRRVHHVSYVDGGHDEHSEKPASENNGIWSEMIGKAGPHYVNDRCAGCHVRNGRAEALTGQPLEKWVFKVANDQNGTTPHPNLGRALQSKVPAGGSAVSEGIVTIPVWQETNRLRKPQYQFSGVAPTYFSARIAPQLVGMGLLEALPESTILARENNFDANGDGVSVSGRANRVLDPMNGVARMGRFGYKAGASSVKHQVANAFNLDMGVMTSVFPNPDCGANQTDCGSSGAELPDVELNRLVKYISLLGVRPQRNYTDAAVIRGETKFNAIGCADCHISTNQITSANHPFGELRSQSIRPYTDLLLHDMGPGLADNLGEGQASGSEWRTAPLWGLGLTACVTGGTTVAAPGSQICTPKYSYLHDGRARSIREAILWHGGEAEISKNSFDALSEADKTDMLKFLESL